MSLLVSYVMLCVCVLMKGGTDITQLKKFASYPGQEGAGQLGDIDEDDEVPGKGSSLVLLVARL